MFSPAINPYTARILSLKRLAIWLITIFKLDADLYPVYASYKKATNAVVRRIATAASGNELGPDGTEWTLKELRLVATNIAKFKGTDIPL